MDLLGEEGEVELESCLCWRGGCLLAMLGLITVILGFVVIVVLKFYISAMFKIYQFI